MTARARRRSDPDPDRPADPRGLAAALGRLLLDAARDHPPPWPVPDSTEDLDEPAIRRKALRRIRRLGGGKD